MDEHDSEINKIKASVKNNSINIAKSSAKIEQLENANNKGNTKFELLVILQFTNLISVIL